MATKNLARTIIEGGRCGYSKWERNHSHKEERALTRQYLARAGEADGGFDALCIGRRPKVYKCFSDKLGAPRRWLRAQVGRPWDKVRSEIFTRFNPHSLAGQHIIFDHLLQEVVIHEETDRWYSRRPKLYVDGHGILRAEKPRKREPWRHPTYLPIPGAVIKWTAGRRVGGREPALYWLEPARTCQGCVSRGRGPCCCPSIDGRKAHGEHIHYKQSKRMGPRDLDIWLALDERIQRRLYGARPS